MINITTAQFNPKILFKIQKTFLTIFFIKAKSKVLAFWAKSWTKIK